MKNDEPRRDSAAVKLPTDVPPTPVVAVGALMEERRRYEAWIEALDARKGVTPEHVFTRVQTDYATRLDAVIKQLNSHSDGLHREITSLSERLDVIRAEQMKERDERAEAELRAHVGEVTPAEWERIAATSDAKLADLLSRHDVIETDLANTRALLEAAQRPSGVFAAINWPEDAAPEPVVAAPVVEEVVPEPAMAEAPPVVVAEPEAMMELPPAVLAAEQQLLDIEEQSAPAAPVADDVPPPVAAPRPSSKFDELAFLSSVVDTPSGVFEAAPEDRADEKTRRDTFARRSVEDAIVNLTETGAPLSDVAPVSGRPSSSSVDGVKSLKCGECGAMNYPTEWYCERCGAELASL
jgi:hypothetical protein